MFHRKSRIDLWFGVWVLGIALFSTRALAQLAPDALVKSVGEDVLKVISKPDAEPANVAKAIEEKIVPHFDFQRMARLAVGKNWREASADQKKDIVDQFRTLLVRSYTTAYSQARGVVIEVKPTKLQAGDEETLVKSQIKLPGGAPPINVDYSMFKNSENWKVYDITVNEVSLIQTYRTTFAEQIKQGGIDGLIAALKEMNKKRATATKDK